ncbi:mCG1030965, partial [Mus musculus]
GPYIRESYQFVREMLSGGCKQTLIKMILSPFLWRSVQPLSLIVYNHQQNSEIFNCCLLSVRW